MPPENGGLFSGATVGGRNPKQPPGMYKNPVNNGINLPTSTGEWIPDFWATHQRRIGKLSWRIHHWASMVERNRPGGPTKAGDQPSGIQSFLGDQMDGIQDGSSSPYHRFVEVVKLGVAGWGILSVQVQCPQYKDGIYI